MKKLLLIIIALGLISCDTESNTESTCDCYKETWIRYNGGQWYFNGGKMYYSNDCTDDGDILLGYSGQGYDYQYRINCE